MLVIFFNSFFKQATILSLRSYYKFTKNYKKTEEYVKNLIMNISRLQNLRGLQYWQVWLLDGGAGNSVILFVKLVMARAAKKK
jgi:hypothetical protein